jgi:hypothetical protein
VGSVAENGGVVGVHADAVAEHLLLVVEVTVGAEVVGEVHFLVHRAPAGGAGGGGGAVREGRHGWRREWGQPTGGFRVFWEERRLFARVYGVVYFKGWFG